MNKDYGQIFSTNNLGIGGSIESIWFDDTFNVGEFIFMCLVDQTLDLYLYRRDADGNIDSGNMLCTVPSTGGVYQSIMAGIRPGYSFKIVGVNNSGSTIYNLKLSMQTLDF